MTETIDHAELRDRIAGLADEIERTESPDPTLAAALALLEDAALALHNYTLATGPADAGVNAKPAQSEPAPGDPVPDGPFLLIMQDEHVSGGLWMRRYAKKRDALKVACNYTGATEMWLFEVSRTFDVGAEWDAFWRSMKIA